MCAPIDDKNEPKVMCSVFFQFFFSSLRIDNTTNLGITRAIYRLKTMCRTMNEWHYSRVLNENEFHLTHTHTRAHAFHPIPYWVRNVLSIRTHTRKCATINLLFPSRLVNMRCIHLYSLNNERIKGIENEELTHRLYMFRI